MKSTLVVVCLLFIAFRSLAFQLDKDVVYDKIGKTPLTMDVYSPEGAVKSAVKMAAPSLVYIHGGCFSGGSKEDIADYLKNLTQEGVVVFSLDYRLSGVALYPAGVTDIQQAVRFIRKNADRFHVDTQKIIVHGESAGGYLASVLGVQPLLDRQGKGDAFSAPLPVVSDWFGRTDFTLPQNSGTDCAASFLGKERSAQNRAAFDGASILPRVDQNAALFHIVQGTNDHQVSPIHSALLANRLWNLDKKVIFTLAEGERHGFLSETPWGVTHRFLQKQWKLAELPPENKLGNKQKVSLVHTPGGDFVVTSPLPAGVYSVDMVFLAADFKKNTVGVDIFDVFFETPGKKKEDPRETPVLLNFDPLLFLSGKKEVHRQFQVISKSDSLHFRFKAHQGQALISRIDIEPLP